LLLVSAAFVLSACGGGTEDSRAVDTPPAINDNGTPVTAVVTAKFDPSNGVVPLPNDLLLGTNDLTLNLPVDPTDPAAGTLNAVNALDGWGTVAPWAAGFSSALDATSVVPGSTVRVFEVSRFSGSIGISGIVRELTPGVDYVTSVSTDDPAEHSILVVPLKPLKEITAYMAVITDGVTDMQGNNATPAQTYFIAKRRESLVDPSGNSTDPLLDNATAQALEPLRQLVNLMEFAAAGAGIDPDSIVLSWSLTTQSITPVMAAVRSTVTPQFSQLANTGINTAALGLGLPGIADIYIGVMNVPYYLGAPSAGNPTAPLTGSWEAAPGGYIAPFDQFGLDPTSTNVTLYNPFPVVKSVQTIPVLVTIPNAGSGMAMPDAGWPVVIFQHGITGNRTNALALADSMALAGFAVVSIDQPLHGVTDTADPLFYIENTAFGPIASERTFDLDFVDNATSALGPDGNIDSSGTHFIQLASLLTARDNNRQAQIDLSVLAVTIPTMDINGDGLADFDGAGMHFVGQSLGSIQGTVFLANEPTVTSGTLSVPGGGIVGLLLGSPTFNPVVLGGLAQLGVLPGSPEFNLFVLAAQTVIDSSDPVNWGAIAAAQNAIVIQEVVGSSTSLPDQVIPNSVSGFPLSGTEPLIRVMGLSPIAGTTQDPMGIRGVTRFLVGSHGSLLDPSASFEATAEMQGEAASMALTRGTVLQVTIPSILQGN
jgi:pimeloyl-ACP methyl ester carboxylesterase